jgi:hypothetical protein
VSEFGPRLAKLPKTSVLPMSDVMPGPASEVVGQSEGEGWTASRHRSLLTEAENARWRLLSPPWASRRIRGEMHKEPESAPREGNLLEWGGAGLRILAGTGLSVGNAAFGITAGLASTIATIGATAVPAYVGVATSIYTGLTQVAEGLEKISKIGKEAPA